jgi:hypothetical protein
VAVVPPGRPHQDLSLARHAGLPLSA